jgi:cellulose biosynthesis protein BcsQ
MQSNPYVKGNYALAPNLLGSSFAPTSVCRMLGMSERSDETLKRLAAEHGLSSKESAGANRFRTLFNPPQIFELAHVRHRLGKERRYSRPIVIAVWIMKGGTGKSTTATELATALSLCGERVLIFDADPQGDASLMLGIDPDMDEEDAAIEQIDPRLVIQHSFMDLLLSHMNPSGSRTKRPDEIPLRDVLKKPLGEYGPHLVPADIYMLDLDGKLNDANRRVEQQISDFIRKGYEEPSESLDLRQYSYILIDCQPTMNRVTANVIEAADAVLAATRCDALSRKNLRYLTNYLEQMQAEDKGHKAPELFVLPTFYREANTRCSTTLTNLNANPLLRDGMFWLEGRQRPLVIPQSEEVSSALDHKLPIGLVSPGSVVADAYRTLARQVIARFADLNTEAQEVTHG